MPLNQSVFVLKGDDLLHRFCSSDFDGRNSFGSLSSLPLGVSATWVRSFRGMNRPIAFRRADSYPLIWSHGRVRSWSQAFPDAGVALEAASAQMGTHVVFDFDSTIIDCDSDPWVVDQLGGTELMNSLRDYLPWNDMMDTVMAALNAQGKTIQDIEEILRTVPLELQKINAIKAARALGCELSIASDANIFFIRTVLEQYDLINCFKDIHTNPAYIDEQQALRILPFHPKSDTPHGCPLCPPNMCKGRIIDSIRASFAAEAKPKRIIYLGDGSGDYCPSIRLESRDYVLPREGYPLMTLISENVEQVKAEVHPWKSAQDMEKALINCIKIESRM